MNSNNCVVALASILGMLFLSACGGGGSGPVSALAQCVDPVITIEDPENMSSDDEQVFKQTLRAAISNVCKWWGPTYTGPFTINIEDSTGPAMALIPAWQGNRGTMLFRTATTVAGRSAITHEVIHVFAPNANRFLAEGFATYGHQHLGGQAAFPNDGQDLHDAASEFVDQTNLHLLDAIATPSRLESTLLTERQNYIAAGSFMRFLIETHGMEKFRELYALTPLVPHVRNSGADDRWVGIYGVSRSTLVVAWQAKLASIGQGQAKSVSRVIETVVPDRVIETVVPELTRAMMASTSGAVTGRIEAVASGNVPAVTVNIAGQSTLYHALKSNAQGMQDGTLDPAQLLGGSSFALSLNAVEGGKAGGVSDIGVWGSGDYRNLSGGDSGAVAWDGDLWSAHLGIDTRLRENLLAGLSASFFKGSFDYTDRTTGTAASGALESRMTSLNPYVRWSARKALDLWATLGYGRGELEINDNAAAPVSSDLSQWSAAVGASGTLLTSDDWIAGGTTRLKLKGEGSLAGVNVEGNGAEISELTVDARQLRLSLEGSHAHKLAAGGALTPAIELGLRHDGGDGETGAGIELGGSLRYNDPASGLTVESHGRTLLAHGGNYEEWGIGGLIRLDPGAKGRGMSLSLVPTWGETQSGVQRLWNDGMTDRAAANDNKAQGRLETHLGYGFGVFGGRGLLTPYSGLSLAGEGARRYSLGSRLEVGSSLNLGLEGERREPANDTAADHGVMLRGQLRF